MAETRLSHVDERGQAQMVDISAKTDTARTATARGRVCMQPETLRLITDGDLPKGDVLGTARLAGIMAAKRTADLIPLCHPLPLTGVEVRVTPEADGRTLTITATCRTTGKTGVEMEALTAVSVAALTLYDMCKAVDRGMVISDIGVTHKAGGKSGTFMASMDPVGPAAGTTGMGTAGMGTAGIGTAGT